MRLALLVVFCSGCLLGPSRPYRVCDRNFEKEHAEEIQACRELQQQYEGCTDAVPQISETYPYYPKGAFKHCSEKYPTHQTCWPESPCEHLYDGISF